MSDAFATNHDAYYPIGETIAAEIPGHRAGELAALQTVSTVSRFGRNQTIFNEGDDANYSYTVVAGGVRLTCYVPRADTQDQRVIEVTAADYSSAAQVILRGLESQPK